MSNQTSSMAIPAGTPTGTGTAGGVAASIPGPPAIDQMQMMHTMMANLGRERMPLPGTLGAPRFNGANIMKFIEIYERLVHRTRTNPDQEDVIDTLPYYCVEDL